MSLDKQIQDPCEVCGLWKTSSVGLNWSAKKVMGDGPKDAKIMFIGESLGQEEVIQQKVFVGSAGKLLNEAITNAGLKREDVYVSNVIKCRPPDNRTPTSGEIKCCLPFLLDEIKEVKPKVICVLGGTALLAILKRKGITSIRGNIFETAIELRKPVDAFDETAFLKIKVIPTLHPAYVLRWLEHPEYKEQMFKDVELVAKASKENNYQKEKKQVNYNLEPSLAEIILLLNSIKNTNKTFTYDIETTGFNFLTDKILTMAISTNETEAFVIDFTKYGEEQELKEALRGIFESKTILKIGANCKFDNKFIRQLGITVKLPQFDTMLAHFLLDENNQHGLKDLAWRYTDMGGYEEDMSKIFKEKVSSERRILSVKKKEGTITQEEYDTEYQKLDNFSLIPIEVLKKYNCADTDCTYRLYNIFKPQLEVERLKHIHDLILMPLQYVLSETEYIGIQIDTEYMKRFEKETRDKIDDILYRINSSNEVKETEKLTNKGILEGDKKYVKFNMNSNKQLQVLLFTSCKLQPVQKTATGYSTDASTLDILSKNSEIARMILEYRKYNHDLTAYIEQLKRNLDKNNKAHTDYMIHGSVSGRIISHEPNLQNIPRDSGVKRLFIADPGCILISADYSQVEYKMLANYTNDPKMLSDINSNLDIHSEMACMVWPHFYRKVGPKQFQYLQTNKIESKIGGEHRVIAKAVVFGVMYGRGIKSLVEDLKITEMEGHKIINTLFAMYPAASEWIENQKRIVKRDKMVTNLFGRRRRLPDIDSKEEQKRAEVYRQCVNTPIQSGASDLCSIATVRCYNNIKRLNLQSRLVLSIHDALKYNTPLNEIEQLIDCVKRGMTDPVKGINFNLEVEFELGPTWGDMIELSEFNKVKDKWLKEWGYIL